MVHSQVVSGWHEIKAKWEPTDFAIYDFLIGKFQRDGKYHLLGFRPTKMAYLFPADIENKTDFGVVVLPLKKTRLNQLVSQDVIHIDPNYPDGDLEGFPIYCV